MKLRTLVVIAVFLYATLSEVSQSHEEKLYVCTDVSIDMTFQLQHENEPEDGEDLFQSSGSCLRSPLIQLLISDMAEAIPRSVLDLPDCFEVSAQQGLISAYRMFPVFSLCSRSSTNITLHDWFNEVLVGLEDFFGPKQSYNNPQLPKKILIGKVDVEVQSFAMSVPYPMPSSSTSAAIPKFNMISSQLWSEASLDDNSFSSYANLTVSNTGDAPLSIFRVVITKADNRGDVLVLTAQDPIYIDPQATSSLFLETKGEATSFQNDIYEMYVSHNGFKSHFFEGQIMKTEFVPLQKLDKLIHRKKNHPNTEVNYGAIRSTDPSFSNGIYQSWKTISMIILCSVGIFAIHFVRRKATQINLLNCFRLHQRQRVKHKSSSKNISLSSKEVDDENDDANIIIEQESFLQTPSRNKGSSNTMSNVSMPAITMQWKRPINAMMMIQQTTHSARIIRLDLDKQVRLHPKRFENMWEEFVDRNTYNITGIKKKPEIQNIVKKMEEIIGIFCMASGTVQGVDKLLFYGNNNQNLNNTIQIKQSIRTRKEINEQLVQEFASITRKVLTDLLC